MRRFIRLPPGLPVASPSARRRTSASAGDTDSAKRTRTALLFAVGSPRASIISSARYASRVSAAANRWVRPSVLRSTKFFRRKRSRIVSTVV